jgi:hypothetical protein
MLKISNLLRKNRRQSTKHYAVKIVSPDGYGNMGHLKMAMEWSIILSGISKVSIHVLKISYGKLVNHGFK